MREFDKPIGRVWRRMRLQRFLGALVWCLAITFAAAAATIAATKLAGRPLPGAAWWPFAIAGGVGLLAAALVAALTGPSRVDAAIAIDRAFHLNDRLATTLTLPDDLRASPAGRALVADTLKHIAALDVREQFGLKAPQFAWVPLVPAVLAVGLLYLNFPGSQARANARGSNEAEKKIVANQMKSISKAIQAKRKEAEKNQLDAKTDKLLAEIEKVAEKLSKTPPAEKDKAMVELNKLTDAVKERQKQLGSPEQIARQLQQLKELSSQGPADDFAKDLAKGDYAKAAQDLKQLQEKLAKGDLTEKEKQALKEQLGQMKQQLEKLANMEQRRKQLEEARKNGAISEKQYQQQMSKLEEQAKDMKKLQQLAQQLSKAQNAMAQGDMKKAAQDLGLGQQELQDLAKQAQELETLDQALADLQDAKNGMSGDGMNQLGQGLDGQNQLGMGNRPGNGGMGLGRGRGQGDRPEAPDNVAAYNARTKPIFGKGKAVVEGYAPPSKQIRGDSVLIDQQSIEASVAQDSEALSNQKIPANVKKHVLGYFDQIRKGQ